MPYISTAELAERPGARELALAASSDTAPVVAYALMDATLRGADRSAWTPEQLAAADAALARVQDAVAEAGALIDGHLGAHPLRRCGREEWRWGVTRLPVLSQNSSRHRPPA